jgi:ribosomal protein S18 acetylase RimI-like enzyme
VDADVLARIDAFLDETVRDSTDREDVGPLRVLLSRRPWPYYARPRAELDLSAPDAVTAGDVRAAAERLEASGAPVAFEWIPERVPSMADAVADLGLGWTTSPLQVMAAAPIDVDPPAGVSLRLIEPDEAAVVAAARVVSEAFGSPHVEEHEHIRRRLRLGLNVTVVAEVAGAVVGVTTLQPIGDVGELVGAATLVPYRRRGIGDAMIRHLVRHAHGLGVELLLLSASEDGVGVYERIGFRTVATLAEAPPD